MHPQKIQLNPLMKNTDHKLCDETLQLAGDYLTGKYLHRLRMADFLFDNFELSCEERNGKAALLAAENTPLEINPVERLAGSAPLKEATMHRVPGIRFRDGSLVYSISHTTGDFNNAVNLGLSGLEKEILERKQNAPEFKHKFYNGMLDAIAAMRIWTARYIAEYKLMLEKNEYSQYHRNISSIIDNLQNVPENPPVSFKEAVQSLWSFFEFQRLCGNWSGIGRIDEILGPYLQNDLEKNIITLDEAREILAHFWIKGTEWCFGLKEKNTSQPGSGDAQNYQNIILSGIDSNGNQIENEVTFLVLDIIEELHISDYPVTVRLNSKTSEKLLRRIAEVQLLGGGIVSVYNEDLIFEALRKCNYPEDEIRNFTNDGCWEIIIPGKTNFTYIPMDILPALQDATAQADDSLTFDGLYEKFLENVRKKAEWAKEKIIKEFHYCGKDPDDNGSYPSKEYTYADTVFSLIMPSCRESGCSYTLYGAKYNIKGLHMGGLPDVANSLYAIKKTVFEKKRISLARLSEILENDWQGEELLQKEIANTLKYYGNDNEEVDLILKKVIDDCAAIFRNIGKVYEIQTVTGVSTFGREIEFAPHRKATPFGMNAHKYLAPNLSPTPGTDKSSLLAVINSYCRMDFTQTPNGCPLDLRLGAGIRKVHNAPDVLAQILRVFIKKGGMYLQIDTVDADVLKEAQKDPDRFPNLAVRISGWSARFASLSKEWQDMIINRTALDA